MSGLETATIFALTGAVLIGIVPGVAEEWEISKDLRKYTFRLRKGAEYHNGRTIDAASVKWNYERIMNPKTSHSFTRASLQDVESIKVVDPYTLQIMLNRPSAIFASNCVYYPCNLIAPDSADQADTQFDQGASGNMLQWYQR